MKEPKMTIVSLALVMVLGGALLAYGTGSLLLLFMGLVPLHIVFVYEAIHYDWKGNF